MRAGGLQVSFAPLDATLGRRPERELLDGDGRIAGRLVQTRCRRHGRLRGCASSFRSIDRDDGHSREWLHLARNFEAAAEAWDEMEFALLLPSRQRILDRVGPDATRVLCAAGLSAAIWGDAAAAPSAVTCKALALDGRPLIVSSDADWRGLVERTPELRILLRWDGRAAFCPTPPDSSARAKVLFVLPVEGAIDSTLVRDAFARWGEKGLHLDIASGLGAGVPDSESLRFIARLRRSGWPA